MFWVQLFDIITCIDKKLSWCNRIILLKHTIIRKQEFMFFFPHNPIPFICIDMQWGIGSMAFQNNGHYLTICFYYIKIRIASPFTKSFWIFPRGIELLQFLLSVYLSIYFFSST